MPPRLEFQQEVLETEYHSSLSLTKPYPIIKKPVKVPLPYYVDRGKMILGPSTNRFWNIASLCAIASCAIFCKFFLKCYTSSTTVYNNEPFLKALMDPNRTRPILTVANHLSTIDDPLIWGNIPLRVLQDRRRIRWVLGAQEICFSTPTRSILFSLGQVIPTVRGAGIYQPIVVPIWHKGFEKVMPEDSNHLRIPNFGKKIVIAYGNPIDFKDLLIDYHEGRIDEVTTRISITDAVFRVMDELKKKVEALEIGKQKKEDL